MRQGPGDVLSDDGMAAGHHGVVCVLHHHIFAVRECCGQLGLRLGQDGFVIFRAEHQHRSPVIANAFQQFFSQKQALPHTAYR